MWIVCQAIRSLTSCDWQNQWVIETSSAIIDPKLWQLLIDEFALIHKKIIYVKDKRSNLQTCASDLNSMIHVITWPCWSNFRSPIWACIIQGLPICYYKWQSSLWIELCIYKGSTKVMKHMKFICQSEWLSSQILDDNHFFLQMSFTFHNLYSSTWEWKHGKVYN